MFTLKKTSPPFADNKLLSFTGYLEYMLWYEKISIREGHFVKIAKLGVNGCLNKLIIPVDENKIRWKNFLSLLKGLNHQKTPSLFPKSTYKEVLKAFIPQKSVTHYSPRQLHSETTPTNLVGTCCLLP